jgi:uncharacterized protein (TIGR00255 family)
MTGFGEAATEVDGLAYSVEIKSVNNRFLKTHLRLPEAAGFLESDIEALIRGSVHRGTVNCALHLKNVSGEALFELDSGTIKGYVKQLKKIAASEGLDSNIDIANMLGLPGIVQAVTPDEETAAKLKETILKLIAEALEKFKRMRSQEGDALFEDLKGNCKLISETLKLIKDRSPVVVTEYCEKLLKRANDLQASAKLELDSEMLIREMAIFADRSDVAEEVTRLTAHLEQFEKHCNNNENVGRRLDFISQEMLREANTIASKASDAQIGGWVIDIKCAIDRIKEQVQNVE